MVDALGSLNKWFDTYLRPFWPVLRGQRSQNITKTALLPQRSPPPPITKPHQAKA